MQPVYSLVSAPAAEPVTLAEAALQVRQDSADDNAILTLLIGATREAFEAEHNIYFVTQTVDAHYPGFPGLDFIRIPRGPMQSITSIKYTTSDDTEYTLAAANYDVDARRGRIVLKDGKQWPVATLRPMDAVVVRCVMGFGGAAAVPQRAKHALLMTLDHLYNHRSDVIVGNTAVEAKRMARASEYLMAGLRYWAL